MKVEEIMKKINELTFTLESYYNINNSQMERYSLENNEYYQELLEIIKQMINKIKTLEQTSVKEEKRK